MDKNELLQALSIITNKFRDSFFSQSKIFVLHKHKDTNFLVPVRRKTNQDTLSGINNKEFADYCQLENGVCMQEKIAAEAGMKYKKFNLKIIFLLG